MQDLPSITASPPPSGRATERLPPSSTGTAPDIARDGPIRALDWNDREDRHEMIAEAAYYKAEQRGFELGYEDMDWLEAEQELVERMAKEEADAAR